MSDGNVIDILKKAIILEQQGQSFYRNVAAQTESEDVKNIFSIMADEEKKHEQILTDQAKKYQQGGSFEAGIEIGEPEEFSSKVLSEKIKGQINAASYEAASISAAVAFEERTVDLYSQRASTASDEAEKAMYAELAKWEKTHLSFLSGIYDDLLESAWYDSSYWPF